MARALHRNRQPMYGFVIAYPRAGASVREAYIKMTLAGRQQSDCGGNLLWLWIGDQSRRIGDMPGAGRKNLAIGVVNLIPTVPSIPATGSYCWGGCAES